MNPNSLPYGSSDGGQAACGAPSCPTGLCLGGTAGSLPLPGPNTPTCPQSTDITGTFGKHIVVACTAPQ